MQNSYSQKARSAILKAALFKPLNLAVLVGGCLAAKFSLMLIPVGYAERCDSERRARHTRTRTEAERQVRAKFPSLTEGTKGWDRAVTNRFKRLLGRIP